MSDVEYWNVDSVIECLLDLDETGKAVEKELLILAPKAYHKGGVPMKRIWKKLTKSAREHIKAKYKALDSFYSF